MLDDLFKKAIIQLLKPKRLEEFLHALEKYITLKECTTQLAKDERIILEDDIVEMNHISS